MPSWLKVALRILGLLGVCLVSLVPICIIVLLHARRRLIQQRRKPFLSILEEK
jgi:hypothetical protein